MGNLRRFLVLYAWPSFQFINSFISGRDILPPIMQSGLPYGGTKTKCCLKKPKHLLLLYYLEKEGRRLKNMGKILGLNLEANSQLTAKLEKPEWTPLSWENHSHLLLWAPPALGDCWTLLFSISSPTADQLPLPTPPWSLACWQKPPRTPRPSGNMIQWHHNIMPYQLKVRDGKNNWKMD